MSKFNKMKELIHEFRNSNPIQITDSIMDKGIKKMDKIAEDKDGGIIIEVVYVDDTISVYRGEFLGNGDDFSLDLIDGVNEEFRNVIYMPVNLYKEDE